MDETTTGGDFRVARENANVSQSEIARYLGITQSYISQVERGWTSVTDTQLTRLYSALDAVQRGEGSSE